MATEKHPQRNINYPFTKSAIEAVRARLSQHGRTAGPNMSPPNGKGSRREVRPGEWIDDRVIVIGGAPEPTDLDRVEPRRETKALPTFVNTKVYSVQLAKPVLQDGQWLKPSIDYEMVGAVCLAISGSILTATELGDIPADPNVPPSE